jgi:hypothetical protein
MHRIILAAVLFAAALIAAWSGTASAETVYATRAMNPKSDGFTPGVVRAGSREANTGVQPTCRVIVANFQYPDGTVRRESKTKCD